MIPSSISTDRLKALSLNLLSWTVTLVIVLVLFLVAATSPAVAQVAPNWEGLESGEVFNWFNDGFGDPLSSVFLNEIFGPLFPSADGSTSQTIFSTIIGYFNVIALVLGGILFTYNVTVGLLQTAHDGSVLGQRWSSLWAPIRVVFAVGLLVPLPGLGGYNLAQSSVAYLVRGSTMAASEVWGLASSNLLQNNIPVASPQARINPDLITTMYHNAVCRRIVDEQLQRMGGDLRMATRVSQIPGEQTTRLRSVSAIVRDGGDGGVETIQGDFDACGWWETPPIPDFLADLAVQAEQGSGEAQDLIRFYSESHSELLDGIDQRLEQVVAAQAVGVEGPPGSVVPSQRSALIDIITFSNAEASRIAAEVRQQMTGVADGQTSMARNSLVERITGGPECTASRNEPGATDPSCYGEGWLGAGSWYMTIARNNAHIATLMTAQAVAAPGGFITDFERATEALIEDTGNGSGWFGGARNRDWAGLLEPEAALRHWEGFTNAYQSDTVALAALGYTLDASETLLVGAASEDRGARAIERFSAEWQEQVVENMASFGGWFDSDPMIKLIDLGQTLVYAAGGLMVLMLLPFIDAAAVSTLLTMIWGAGAFLAFILPLMPYILWIVAITGYFLLVVEAVVAVTLWAFAHLRMDGDGISGTATAGWTMLLSLILTPVLMVFGFIVGMTLFRVTAGLLIGGIFPAMSGILGGVGGILFLLALPAIVIMVAIMMLILIERSFSLISEFPNRVLAWIGGRTDLADQGALDRTRAGMIGGAAGLGGGGAQVLTRMGNVSDRAGKAALALRKGRAGNGGGTNNP